MPSDQQLAERFRAKLVARNLGTTEVRVYPATVQERQQTGFAQKMLRHYDSAKNADYVDAQRRKLESERAEAEQKAASENKGSEQKPKK